MFRILYLLKSIQQVGIENVLISHIVRIKWTLVAEADDSLKISRFKFEAQSERSKSGFLLSTNGLKKNSIQEKRNFTNSIFQQHITGEVKSI